MIDDIIKTLEELADPERIDFAKRNYPTALKVIGVTGPNLRLVLKEMKAIMQPLPDSEKISILKKLVNTNIIECQQLAYDFLDKNRKIFGVITPKHVDEFIGGIDNWVVVDYYGACVVGIAWQKGIINIDRIKQFYNSDNFWERRIAIVATVSLNQKARGGTVDVKQTLEICKLAVADHHDMINKALSWALRVLAQREKQPVIDFIDEHEKLLHARVLREVNHKLNFGTKN